MLSREADDDAYCLDLKNSCEWFDDCCQYPTFQIPSELFGQCNEQYPVPMDDYDQGYYDICPFYVCVYGPYSIITRDANGNITSSEPDPVAILNAFLSSVVNDSSLWEPVMKNVVTRCNDQFGGVSIHAQCGLPNNMWDVVQCTYKQEMLQCPDWNYQRLPNCSYNYEWISKCY